MMNFDKGSAVFKHSAQDFIVEEVWDEQVCEVSANIAELDNARVDFGRLDTTDRRDFLTCELEKTNIDHFSLMSILAKELGNLPHEIGYAGTKDKQAWTCQKISIFNADIDRIRNFSYSGIKLKNFKWAKHKIKIGDLKGNRFRVVLRDVDKEAIKILSRVRNSEYIPNFFGAQRFGSLRKENVLIGKLILKKRYMEAVFSYLTSFGEEESYEVQKAKKRLKTDKNILAAKEYFPSQLRAELRILEYLSENKEDYLGALRLIGEKTLLIMCQAVQSKIFNDTLEKAIDEKIELHNKDISLLGYNGGFTQGRVGHIEEETLRAYDLRLSDFEMSDIPFLSLKHSTRKAFFKVRDLDVDTGEDELFMPAKKIILTFSLNSGTYATTFLEQFFELR